MIDSVFVFNYNDKLKIFKSAYYYGLLFVVVLAPMLYLYFQISQSKISCHFIGKILHMKL